MDGRWSDGIGGDAVDGSDRARPLLDDADRHARFPVQDAPGGVLVAGVHEQELRIRTVALGIGPHEAVAERRPQREDAGAPDRVLRHRGRQPPSPRGFVEAVDPLEPPVHAQGVVVVVVLADARELAAHGHADGAQHVRASDPGELEELGRADRPGDEDHPAPGPDVMLGPSAPDPRAGASAAVECQAERVGVRHHAEVRASAGGSQVRVVRAPTATAELVDLVVAEPGLVQVVVLHEATTVLHGRTEERIGGGEPLPNLGDVQRPVAAPSLAVLRVVLDAPEVRLDVRVRPARRSGGGPAVVVGRLTARVHHAVDEARPAQPAPAGQGDRAAVGVRIGLGLVAPVVAPAAQQVSEARREANERAAGLAAGLDEQHPVPTGLRQAAREDAPRRAASHDQVVEIVHWRLRCVVTAHGPQICTFARPRRRRVTFEWSRASGRAQAPERSSPPLDHRLTQILAEALPAPCAPGPTRAQPRATPSASRPARRWSAPRSISPTSFASASRSGLAKMLRRSVRPPPAPPRWRLRRTS